MLDFVWVSSIAKELDLAEKSKIERPTEQSTINLLLKNTTLANTVAPSRSSVLDYINTATKLLLFAVVVLLQTATKLCSNKRQGTACNRLINRYSFALM